MRFLVDAQLPRALERQMSELGHDAMHVKDLPRGGETSDSEITTFADSDGWVVVTKDGDFRHTHEIGGHPRLLLLITLGNLRNRDLLAYIVRHHAAVVAAFDEADFLELGEAGLTIHPRR